jgi:ABC-type uncharacterized transport system auxiliary subunit
MNRPCQDPRRRSALRSALRRLPLLGVAPLSGLLGACSLQGSAPRMDFHVLRDLDDASPVGTPPARIERVLLVTAATAPALYDSDRMVFSADGRARSYYQFSYWSERPARRLAGLAEARLARTQVFREVAASTSGVRGDLLLSLRLEELYLDDAVDPGQVRLALAAELIDWRSRSLVARRDFSQVVPVARRDAGGVAQAASQGVTVLLGELTAWAAASAASAA